MRRSEVDSVLECRPPGRCASDARLDAEMELVHCRVLQIRTICVPMLRRGQDEAGEWILNSWPKGGN